MLNMNEVESVISQYKPVLESKFNVKSIGIFGSYARNEQRSDSDLDVLVEFSKPVGIEFFELKIFLEDLLGLNIDLGTVDSIRPQLKDKILNEVVMI